MKKLNIALIILLLVFQTIASPASVFAAESQVQSSGDSIETSTDTNPPADPPIALEAPTEETTDSQEPSTPELSGDGNLDDSTSTVGEEGSEGNDTNGSEAITTDEGDNENNKSPPVEGGQELDAASNDFGGEIGVLSTPEEITGVTLKQFDMKINGSPVTEGVYTTPLPQTQTASFNVNFAVPINKVYADGSWFEFEIPDSIIDFSNAFNGTKTDEGITYTYSLQDGTPGIKLIRVEVSGVNIGNVNTEEDYDLTFNFKAGFDLSSDEVEQKLVLPKANAGSDTISTTFKFLPSTTNEKTKKVAVGSPTLVNGNHQMSWRVWVNEAGKDFVNPSISDNPTDGHAIVDGSVNVWKYEVGLEGVKDATKQQVVTNGSMSEIAFVNGHAYEIEYKTEVNLSANEREGQKTFGNTFTFKNNGGIDTTPKVSQTVSYGKALEKVSKGGATKYKSEWEINFNYNEVNISAADASITDTISTSDSNYKHLIDTTSIKVYEVTIDPANGQEQSVASTPIDSSAYTVTSVGSAEKATGFTLKFNNNVNRAYKVVYETNYDGPTFYDKDGNTTITNEVTFGEKEDDATLTLRNSLLTKEEPLVDFETKKIKWTIKISNDHPTKSITGLTLNDQFEMTGKTGEHTLVGDASNINVSNSTGTKTVDGDNKGFNITNIAVNPNSTVTVTYETSFAISDEGTVVNEGYGNTATTNWTIEDETYNQSRERDYTPSPTTQNNGTKKGFINYQTQEFTWEVRVNINKKDIQSAILTDVIGDGHEFVDGSLAVYPLTLGVGDDVGTYNTNTSLIEGTNYTISVNSDKKGYTLTFNSTLDSTINNKAYVVVYKTKDSNNIFGIESSDEKTLGNVYRNSATFQTKGNQTFNLISTPVTIANDVANSLIKKGEPNQTAATETITWMLEVNKSHSNLGATTVSDNFSDNLMLIRDSIELRAYNVTPGAVSNGSTWVKPEAVGATVTYSNTGFTLSFDNLTTGYQVSYRTLATGNVGDTFSNEAKIEFAGETAKNQKTSDKVNRALSFSSSDASLSGTTGTMKFKKIGVDSETGIATSLENVNFELYKRIGSTDYLLRTAKTDSNGEFEFTGMRYSTYIIKEVAAPTGYVQMPDKTFLFNDSYNTENDGAIIQLVNTTPLEAGACSQFELTIHDIDSNPVSTKTVTIKDTYGTVVATKTTDAQGKITVTPAEVNAGTYTIEVQDINLGDNNTVTVKYPATEDCKATVQPKIACDKFEVTITGTVEDVEKLNGKSLTLKPTAGGTNVTTTVVNGKFELTVDKDARTPKAGDYTVYHDQQYLGTITVTYTGDCKDELPLAPTCEEFTITIRDVDGKLQSGATVKLTKKDTNDTTGVSQPTDPTNASGQVTIVDLKPGEYDVYIVDGGTETKIGTIQTDETCSATVQPAPSCPTFTITLEKTNGTPRSNATITLKEQTTSEVYTGTTDSLGVLIIKTNKETDGLKAGTYDVYEGKLYLGEIEVSYQGNTNNPCAGNLVEIEDSNNKAFSCPQFTLTLLDRSGNAREGVNVQIRDAEENVIYNGATEGATDVNGKITIGTDTMKEGTYSLYEDGRFINTFVVDGECEATVKPKSSGGGGYTPPPTCPVYTITVKDDEGNPRSDVFVTVKDKEGNVVSSGTTNTGGKVTVPNTVAPGEYTVFEGDTELGKVTVDFTEGNCEGEVTTPASTPAPTCPEYTITVKDDEGNPRSNASVTVKDKEGNVVSSGTTNTGGKVTVPNTVQPGEYTVFEGDTELGKVTVDFTEGNCEGEVTIGSPKDPTPGESEEDPTPGKPGEDGEDSSPNKPGQSGGEISTPGDDGDIKGGSDSKEPPTITPGTDNSTDTKGKGAEKLPQTDGQDYLFIMLTGALLILVSSVLLFRRKKEQI